MNDLHKANVFFKNVMGFFFSVRGERPIDLLTTNNNVCTILDRLFPIDLFVSLLFAPGLSV